MVFGGSFGFNTYYLGYEYTRIEKLYFLLLSCLLYCLLSFVGVFGYWVFLEKNFRMDL